MQAHRIHPVHISSVCRRYSLYVRTTFDFSPLLSFVCCAVLAVLKLFLVIGTKQNQQHTTQTGASCQHETLLPFSLEHSVVPLSIIQHIAVCVCVLGGGRGVESTLQRAQKLHKTNKSLVNFYSLNSLVNVFSDFSSDMF